MGKGTLVKEVWPSFLSLLLIGAALFALSLLHSRRAMGRWPELMRGHRWRVMVKS